MIKAVVLDFDDTLCMSEAACFRLENEVLTTLGREPMTRDLHLETWGMPLYEAILDRSPGVDIERFKKTYRQMLQEFVRTGRMDAISGQCLKTLDELIGQGLRLMIHTSRTAEELHHIMAADNPLHSRIKAFYHRENTHFHKPDGRAFEELLADSRLRPDECVYVGDSPIDAAAGNGAGFYFIASLESGLRDRGDFTGLNITAYIDHFGDLPNVIAKIRLR